MIIINERFDLFFANTKAYVVYMQDDRLEGTLLSDCIFLYSYCNSYVIWK